MTRPLRHAVRVHIHRDADTHVKGSNIYIDLWWPAGTAAKPMLCLSSYWSFVDPVTRRSTTEIVFLTCDPVPPLLLQSICQLAETGWLAHFRRQREFNKRTKSPIDRQRSAYYTQWSVKKIFCVYSGRLDRSWQTDSARARSACGSGTVAVLNSLLEGAVMTTLKIGRTRRSCTGQN